MELETLTLLQVHVVKDNVHLVRVTPPTDLIKFDEHTGARLMVIEVILGIAR